MSEFPKSGVGSWAQWRRRRHKMGYAHAVVDSRPDPEWIDRHAREVRGKLRPGFATIGEITRDIADRKAG